MLQNFYNSSSKYLLITEDRNIKENLDIPFGSWARRNLSKKPFKIGKSLLFVNDHDIEDENKLSGLGLYEIKNLKNIKPVAN